MKSQEPRSTSSCAACKFLKRRCTPNCLFAPYFRGDEPKKFAKVHKVFGASNVSKILNEVAEDQREDTVNSLVYEAEVETPGPGLRLHRRYSVTAAQDGGAAARPYSRTCASR
ncbi:LOB domain-containing protein 21 [Phtheirospermum japonicum]|uniref:LOB domain-containing protein 21 n=1 Tax=Phtheirospermum japonicum TaxID=374723 RepID=A0A830CMF9_9LAMI|nr:LOB domain-containing protein 21 [Phtheirospermum japonicum]